MVDEKGKPDRADNPAVGFLLWWDKCLSCGAEIKNGMDKDGRPHICKEVSG